MRLTHTARAALAALLITAVLSGCNKSPTSPEVAAAPPAVTAGPSPTPAIDDASSAAKVFEDRIVPIFKSPDPSSCTRCHLASVDIKDYILPSARDTFLAMREQGLIDHRALVAPRA